MQLQHDFPLTNGKVQVMQPGMKEASHIVTCDKSHIFNQYVKFFPQLITFVFRHLLHLRSNQLP